MKNNNIYMIKFFLLFLISTVSFSTAANNALPPPVIQALKKHQLPQSSMSVYIKQITGTDPIVQYRIDTPRNPASVMKLITTLAGLELLGPAYHWTTEFYTDGILSNGVLQGDVYIKGGGDPFFTRENFWHSLFNLQEKGIRHIKGDLIIDNSLFTPENGHPGNFDKEPYRAYNAFPDAALLNFTAQQFVFLPSRNKVKVYSDPPQSNLEIKNRLVTSSGKCGNIARSIYMDVSHNGPKTTVEFSGKYPSRCGEQELLRSVTNNTDYTYGVFRSLWERMGGTITGEVKTGSLPRRADFIHKHKSLPLTDIIKYINKYSNNVMARQLFLTIGKENAGAPGTKQTAGRAIRKWLNNKSIDHQNFIIENGAGLSRVSRITASSLGQLLDKTFRSALRPEFMASLPIAGVDGTMKKRFRGNVPAGRMRLKTGLLNDVRAMAGYVVSKTGRTYVVVSLQNHPGVQNWTGTAIQNALLDWLYQNH